MGLINHAILESYAFAYNATTNPNPVQLRFALVQALPIQFAFENEGEAGVSNLVTSLEDSADGLSWSAVSGSSVTVVPGGRAMFNAVCRAYVRLASSGTGGGTMIVQPRTALEIIRI